MSLIKHSFLFLLILVLNNCGSKNTTYKVKGTIRSMDLSIKEVTIAHDTIKNLMLPMVMPFRFSDKNEMIELKTGDSVHFDFIWGEKEVFAKNFTFIGPGFIPDKDDFFSDEYSEKKIGSIIDDAQLLNLDSSIVRLSDSDGDYRFISYIFSRCPMPNLCPAVFMKNKILSESFRDNNNLKFILVSFDYKFDTPSVLKSTYGPSIEGSPNIEIWSSTGYISDVYQLVKQTGGDFWGIEKEKIGHTLVSVLIDPERKILGSWEGDKWPAKQVENSIKLLLK